MPTEHTTPSWHFSNEEYSFVATPNTVFPVSTIRYVPDNLTLTLTETYDKGSRWYLYDGQAYPSITTLISETDAEGKQALREWRLRVGMAESSRITKTAADNGTKWHNFCEAYVTGQSYWRYVTTPYDRTMASAIGRLLNDKIDTVILSESRVVSTSLGVAGRMDICAILRDGRVAVIDFKTGRKQKSGNRLQNYGIQACFYATALTEHLNRGRIEDIVIMQILPDALIWQESKASQFLPLLEERIRLFASQV